jgi:hypothetical protein
MMMTKKYFLLALCFLLQNIVEGKDFKGFYDYNYNEQTGKVSLKINNLNQEFLLVTYFSTGLGSNDIGFDRGKITSQRLVKFERYGNKVALVESNPFFRARSTNKNEVKVTENAFAKSILWMFNIENENDGVTVDLSLFLTEDLSNIAYELKEQKQGNYKLDKTKSAIDPSEMFAFPKNIEFESWLSFTGEATGDYLKNTVVNKDVISMKQHISMVELPDNNYTPRVFHPYSGYFSMNFFDYATPIHEPIEKRFIQRHRLQKQNPNQSKSLAVEPIIYYVDNGCPEPIKSALIEGAKWWNQAFEEAGFIDAFQVKELPEGAHPLDVRYNTIQWVHRSTRGWSYGSTVSDPRTGEIIKGHVSLGSLRVRQDFMIAQGLLSLYEGNKKDHGPMTSLALARLRQLSAHEVGHTIGLAHNFAASNNNKASVMDYPHPQINIDQNSNLDATKAYDDKIGLWDKRAIVYGYSEFKENEEQNLQNIIKETKALNLNYLSDPDSRPDGSAAVNSHLWDNGLDAIDELERIIKYRKIALSKFGLNSIPVGTPLSELEKVLVPLYYAHRYQVEAVSKAIGGMEYGYTLKGDEDKPMKNVSPEIQTKALLSILNSTQPEVLLLAQNIQNLLLPSAMGYERSRESFANETGYGFDQNAAATSAIDHAFNLLFNSQRMARINNQGEFSTNEYLNNIYKQIKTIDYQNNELTKIAISRHRNFILRLIGMVQLNKKGYIASAAISLLEDINKDIPKLKKNSNPLVREHYSFLTNVMKKFNASEVIELPLPIPLPPGAPIGCE